MWSKVKSLSFLTFVGSVEKPRCRQQARDGDIQGINILYVRFFLRVPAYKNY